MNFKDICTYAIVSYQYKASSLFLWFELFDYTFIVYCCLLATVSLSCSYDSLFHCLLFIVMMLIV